MQWSKAGAHLLLQTRTQALDGTLRETFRKWYPAWPQMTPRCQPPQPEHPTEFYALHDYRTPRQIYEMQCPWTSGRSAAPNGSASRFPSKIGNRRMLTVAPIPTGINNKDLEIENIAVTLRLAPTPMPGINTAQ